MAIDQPDKAIYINNFSIAADGLTIDVNVETTTGYIIDAVKFWTDSTFKVDAEAIDLADLLVQSSNKEIFTISAQAVGLTSFYDGIFFIQFGTTAPDPSECISCNTPLGVAAKLISAKICLLEKVLAVDVCSDCNSGCSCVDTCDILTLSKYIESMSIAIQFGFYEEAIDLLNGIRKQCTTCSECLDFEGVSTNAGLSYYTLDNSIILL